MSEEHFPRFEEQKRRIDEIAYRSEQMQVVLTAAKLASVFTAYKHRSKLEKGFVKKVQNWLTNELSNHVTSDVNNVREEFRDKAVETFSDLLPLNSDAPDILQTFVDQLDRQLAFPGRNEPPNTSQ